MPTTNIHFELIKCPTPKDRRLKVVATTKVNNEVTTEGCLLGGLWVGQANFENEEHVEMNRHPVTCEMLHMLMSHRTLARISLNIHMFLNCTINC